MFKYSFITFWNLNSCKIGISNRIKTASKYWERLYAEYLANCPWRDLQSLFWRDRKNVNNPFNKYLLSSSSFKEYNYRVSMSLALQWERLTRALERREYFMLLRSRCWCCQSPVLFSGTFSRSLLAFWLFSLNVILCSNDFIFLLTGAIPTVIFPPGLYTLFRLSYWPMRGS